MFVRAAENKQAGGFDLGGFYASQTVEVWPENHRAFMLFDEMRGQWRTSAAGGAIALDYTPLFLRMDRMGLGDDEWNELFADVRAMAGAALEQMHQDD